MYTAKPITILMGSWCVLLNDAKPLNERELLSPLVRRLRDLADDVVPLVRYRRLLPLNEVEQLVVWMGRVKFSVLFRDLRREPKGSSQQGFAGVE